MKVTTLVENTTINEDLKKQHGLSLHIETRKHKILLDLGCNNLFADNAKKLGVDIPSVDTVIISHGHYDHGGGLKRFLQLNTKAKIYIQKSAFSYRYKYAVLGGLIKKNIGLDKSFENNPQIVLACGDMKIDDELLLITNPIGKNFLPKQNNLLMQGENGKYAEDSFNHEQSLLIFEDKTVLFSGCSHRGIVNITELAKTKTDKKIDYAVGGFHLFTLSNSKKDLQLQNDLANTLNKHNTDFYTCHCTGKKAYNILKSNMGNKLNYLATGQTITL